MFYTLLYKCFWLHPVSTRRMKTTIGTFIFHLCRLRYWFFSNKASQSLVQCSAMLFVFYCSITGALGDESIVLHIQKEEVYVEIKN